MLNFSHFHLRNHVMIIIMFTVKPLSWRTDFTTNPACQSPLFKDKKYTSRSPTCPNCPEILVQAWKFVFFVICISHRALKVSKGTNHNYSCSFAHYTKEMLFLLLFLSYFVWVSMLKICNAVISIGPHKKKALKQLWRISISKKCAHSSISRLKNPLDF